MKKICALLLFVGSFAQAREIGTQINFAEHTPKMKAAILESYRQEGLQEVVVKRIELELYGLESMTLTEVGNKKTQIEAEFSFSSSYVRDERDGVSDYCTVKMQSNATYDIAGTWRVISANCEAFD